MILILKGQRKERLLSKKAAIKGHAFQTKKDSPDGFIVASIITVASKI